ncbi:hypothetical protein, partial [Pseudomonas syringae]
MSLLYRHAVRFLYVGLRSDHGHPIQNQLHRLLIGLRPATDSATRTRSVQNGIPTLEWCDPRRLDATFGGVMGKYTEQAKLAAVKEYCAGKA